VSGTQQRAQFMATRTTRRRCRWDESSDKPTSFRGQLTRADATRAGRIPNWQMRHRSSGR
jgi:hypothetical protein